MKKNLLYAMMAVGMLASCSQSESEGSEPVNPELSPDAIMISAVAPPVSLTVSGRSSGTVGGNGDVTNDTWNGQKLRFFAFPKDAATGITISDKIETTNIGSLPFYNEIGTAASGETAGITWEGNKTLFFPRTGAYDFFGYYADDAVIGNPLSKAITGTNVLYAPFTIDGSQDLMLAKAELTDDDKALPDFATGDYNKAYSSYTARKGVQPKMKFEHLLTRLVFKIKGLGDESPENVYVRSIKVTSRKTGELVFVYSNAANKGIKWTDVAPTSYLSLQERNGTTMQALDYGLVLPNPLPATKAELANPAVLGKYNASVKGGDPKLVGEALLVSTESEYTVEMEVVQYYDEFGNLITDPAKRSYTYKGTDLVLKPSDVVPSVTAFKPSTSYNVTIAVYGLQGIKLVAELGKWENGGTIEKNPDDQFKN